MRICLHRLAKTRSSRLQQPAPYTFRRFCVITSRCYHAHTLPWQTFGSRSLIARVSIIHGTFAAAPQKVRQFPAPSVGLHRPRGSRYH